MDSYAIKWRRNIAENCNRLSTVHERYRRQTDRQTTDRIATDRIALIVYFLNVTCIGLHQIVVCEH